MLSRKGTCMHGLQYFLPQKILLEGVGNFQLMDVCDQYCCTLFPQQAVSQSSAFTRIRDRCITDVLRTVFATTKQRCGHICMTSSSGCHSITYDYITRECHLSSSYRTSSMCASGSASTQTFGKYFFININNLAIMVGLSVTIT